MSIDGPKSLEHALELLSRTPMPILAGGTDFFPALRDAAAPDKLLDVSRLQALRGIQRTATGWRLGAATTWSEIIREPLPPVFNTLKEAAREVGSVQIQNAGTLAGNLCNASPAADGVPPLLTLNARVELASVRGTRQLPLQEFILGPRLTARSDDELLTAIHVPDIQNGACSQFVKLGARRYLVISIVMASIVLVADEQGRLSDVRVAVGACSAVARRLSRLEAVLQGQSLYADLQPLVNSSLFNELEPIDDVRGSADYRLQVVQQLVRRLLASGLHALACTSTDCTNDGHPEKAT